MFKLESYITPILLSYVDKYIKNFRPEDSQVSLWGGDASFHNLDLRLEVLEQELQLPFSFVSGHIHELLIHVPWTKLASEPIHITINTIECILMLKGDESNTSDTSSLKSSRSGATGTSKDSRRRAGRRQDVVAPPGYIQSLVNKIVSNITIVCNNLILKYVEEDIVLSVNIRTVTLQSANEKWEPAFTEQSHQVIIRKLIDLTDLTVCLDKRTSSGKIESYQEPLLYRCPMVIHLLRSYRSSTAKQASTTRIDVKCGRMDFSITEQQVPMVMRLVKLSLALHSRELRPEETSTLSEPEEEEEEEEEADSPEDESLEAPHEASWAGWAWSFVPSLLPTDWDEDWSGEQQVAYKGHTFHSGVYVSEASISLKYSEQAPERGYYAPRKVKFVTFLSFNFMGCYMEMISHGVGWMNVQLGVSQARIEPHADCFCGVSERPILPDTQQEAPFYLNSGIEQDYYLADSLFDPAAPENKGKRKGYSNSWDYHLGCYSESSLLARTAAFAFDYLYVVDLADDYGSEQLSELGSDLEYSNLAEKVLCRIVFGQTVVNICSGLLHRIQMIQHAASFYDYSPYTIPKPELSLEQLPPASSDDFEALNENIPLVTFRVTLFQPVVNLHLIDHPNYDAGKLFEQRKRKISKRHVPHFVRQDDEMPVFSIECQCLDASFVRPMYPRRLVTTACKLPSPPPDMFHACHKHVHIKAIDFKAQLMMNSKAKPVTVLMPCALSYDHEMLLMTEYWVDTDLFHYDRKMSADSVTIILTNPKLLVISYILQSLIIPGTGLDIMFTSSLLYDAGKDVGIEFLELNAETLRCRHVTTPVTRCVTVSVGVVRAFVLFTPDSSSSVSVGPQQALVLSGPATDRERRPSLAEDETTPLLEVTLQLPSDPAHLAHPPLLICNLRELHVCVDPLLWRWLRYGPYPTCGTWENLQPSHKVASEANGRRPTRTSADNGRRPTPQESVHSSSDRPASRGSAVRETVTAITNTSAEGSARMEGWRSMLLYWFPVWRGLVISGDVAHCVIYLPTASLSAVGVETIQEALVHYGGELLVVRLPYVTLRSAAQKQGLHKYASQLPITLPDNLWSSNKVSFPWNLAFVDLSCHTIHSATRLDFIKPVSANATIGISTKYHQDEVTLMALNFCVHVDTSRVKLAASDVQMTLIAQLISGLLEVSSAFTFHNAPPSDGPAVPDPQTGTGGVSHASPPPMYQEGTVSRDTSVSYPSYKLLKEMSREGQPGSLICDLRRSNVVNLTANMQWTLARLSLYLYTDDLETLEVGHKLKLEFDMDDIFTSLDLQEIYMKIKCKVAAASILHYRKTPKRPRWKHGPYLGLVMRANEELSLSDTDDSEFLCVTFTRARCKNTQSRWGIMAPQRKLRRTSHIQAHPDTQLEISEVCYISEIVLKLQPVDFVLSPQTMTSFMTILNPLNVVPERQRLRSQRSDKPNLTQLFNNHTLPLLYVDTKAMRLLLPCSELTDVGGLDDVCVIQIDSVVLQPQAINPIGRSIIRPDLYATAERTRTINVPGADIEDRQYQLDVSGFSLNTGTWQDLDRSLSVGSAFFDTRAALRTMSENPAVQWNYMATGQESITPHVTLTPVITRLEVCIVAAPAIIDRRDVLICGHSFEVNALSDIEVAISTETLLLASKLCAEVIMLVGLILKAPQSKMEADSSMDVLLSDLLSNERIINVTDLLVSKDSGLNVDNVSVGSMTAFNRTPQESASIQEKSSGYHEDDSVSRGLTSQSPNKDSGISKGKQRLVPIEILVTAGSVSVILYENMHESSAAFQVVLEQMSLRARESKSSGRRHSVYFHDEDDTRRASTISVLLEQHKGDHVQPLLFWLLAQPHLYLSRRPSDQKMQISLFDLSVRASSPNRIVEAGSLPTRKDFPDVLLETKSGDPHPDTGCPPSFLTSKWHRVGFKSPKLTIDFGRPTKLHCSLDRYTFLQEVVAKVQDCLTYRSDQVIDDKPGGFDLAPPRFSFAQRDVSKLSFITILGDDQNSTSISSENESESLLMGLHELGGQNFEGEVALTTQQLVLFIDSSAQVQLVVSLANLSGKVHHPLGRDRITGRVALACLTVTTVDNGAVRLVLNPWSCSAGLSVAWEPWLPPKSPPHVQVTADSDCFLFELGPEQLSSLHKVWSEYRDFLPASSTSDNRAQQAGPDEPKENAEHQETSEHEQYYRDDLRAGAFQFMDTMDSSENLPLPYQVVFWQDPPMMSWRYPQPRALTRVDVFPVPFKVAIPSKNADRQQVFCWLQYWSEARARYQTYAQFTLSECEMRRLELPGQTVACAWRVQLALSGEDDDEVNPARITINPRTLAACMRVDSFFSPRLVPVFQAALNVSSMQLSLYNHVTGDRPLPKPLRQYTWDGLVPTSQGFLTVQLDKASFYACGWAGKARTFEVSSHFRLDVLDYAYLTQHCVVEPFRAHLSLTVDEKASVSCVSRPISIRVGPAVGHTLAVSALLWSQALREYRASSEPLREEGEEEADRTELQVVLTRIILCNDTAGSLRFGQFATDEDILLGSRQCHMYAWRSQKSRPLLRVCMEGAWVWSQPFPVDTDGTECYPLEGPGRSCVIVKVSPLSGTQKQVTVSGQLRIVNLLAEHLECRVVETDGEVKSEQGMVAMGDSTPPSVFLDPGKRGTLRVRFNGLETWSGDIPLKPNAKTGQPWLVKVPLQDRGQFLCVWCHVVEGTMGSVLAALYPLYSLRSLLPIPATLAVDTPGLNVHLTCTVKGSGAEQQLYCPGTTDHTHRLTLQLDSCPPSPSVPLSYAMLERRRPSRTDGEMPDIYDVLAAMKQPSEPRGWPFAGDEYADVEWVTPVQPQTEILVHYEQRGPYCATLQVQLQPWALVLNTLGVDVDLVVDETMACRIPHRGVLMPPRLDGTFHLAVRSLDSPREPHSSPPLSLHSPSAGFYAPRVAGLVPADGAAPVLVECGRTVVLFSVSCRHVPAPGGGAIVVLHARPSFVCSNTTNVDLRVACVAARGAGQAPAVGDVVVDVPVSCSRALGRALVHWATLGDDGDAEPAPYIAVSVGDGWSRPLPVGDGVRRRGFSVGVDAFVLTSQELDGQTFLTIHREPHPHIVVSNLCAVDLMIGEESPSDKAPVLECQHFDWHCRVDANSSAPYSLPSLSAGYPDIAIGRTSLPSVVLALAGPPTDEQRQWSTGFSVSAPRDQFLRLPHHGDVRVRVELSGLTSRISVEPVGHVEISAGEIRTRLSRRSVSDPVVSQDAFVETIFINSSNSLSVTDTVADTLSNTITNTVSDTVTEALTEIIANTATKSISETLADMPSETISETIADTVSERVIEPDTESKSPSKLSMVSFRLDSSRISLKSRPEAKPSIMSADNSNDSNLPSEEEPPRPEPASPLDDLTISVFAHGLALTLLEDSGPERTEVIAMSLVDAGATWGRRDAHIHELRLCVGDLQLDNQMFGRGGFDFPVALTRTSPYRPAFDGFSLAVPADVLTKSTSAGAVLTVVSAYEGRARTLTDVRLTAGPLSLYIEDTLLLKLVDTLFGMLPGNLALTPADHISSPVRIGTPIPSAIRFGTRELARPIRLRSLTIDPIELLLSVHAYIKLYLALDRSPLTLHALDRGFIETSWYRLGKVFALHYISDAILGAGWVVGSMELLGSPGGLCRTVGSGIRDFVALPALGILEGPRGFLAGATHGSASLLRHCAAGALGSVTGLATSVARNLDCLSLDSEHVQRSEELRRLRPQGIRQGLAQGLSGFGINLLGAVGGIAHHPLQAAMSGNATPRNVAAGVGVGIVGAIVKPLSGAAELVASAGRGLLQGTGWSMLPEPRAVPIIEHAFAGANSRLKYRWKLSTGPGILHVAEATYVTQSGSYEAVALVLTTRALFLVDTEADETRRVLSLAELTGVDHAADPTLLCFAMAPCLDADAACRARVADYVKHSSGHVQDEGLPSAIGNPVGNNPADAPLTFYVNPQARNYFLAILRLAKRQSQGHGFSIL